MEKPKALRQYFSDAIAIQLTKAPAAALLWRLKVQDLNSVAFRPYFNNVQGAMSLPDAEEVFKRDAQQSADEHTDHPGVGDHQSPPG